MVYLKGATEESLKKRTFAKTQAGKVKHLWLGITTTHLDLREQRGRLGGHWGLGGGVADQLLSLPGACAQRRNRVGVNLLRTGSVLNIQ